MGKKKGASNDTFIVYEHTTGHPYLIDKETGTMGKVPLNVTKDGVAALKDEHGFYREEVKLECRRLYMAGVRLDTIAERTGVPFHRISAWAYDNGGRGAPNGWCKQRKEVWAEVKLRNEERYTIIERSALKRVEEYLKSEASRITSPQDFAVFASGLERITKAVVGTKATPAVKNPTQINVFANATPLTPEESRRLIENDPIRKLAAAKSEAQVNAIITDVEVIEPNDG